MAEFGRKITEDLELCRFDGVNETVVYTGGLCLLVPANIQWRNTGFCEITETELEYLNLSEIVKQLPHIPLITVVVNGPLRGEIYQYGNYGPEWWCIGETMGYA